MFGCILSGQPAMPPLTLDDCIRKALAVPSPVSLARRDREIADKALIQARAGFLPQAAIGPTYTYNSPSLIRPGDFSFAALNGVHELSALVTIFQEIDTSGRLRAEYARARADQDATAASLAITERELKRAVAGAYYRLLLARHLVDVVRAALDESSSFENRARLLAQGGEAARADVVKASAQVAFLRQSLSAAVLAADMANQDLAAFWTRDVADPLPIVDSFEQTIQPPEPAPSPAGTPYLRRLEFRLLNAEYRALQAETRVARSSLYPRLSVAFQWGVDAVQPRWDERGYAVIGSLNLTVFDWFKSISSVRQAQARTAQAVDREAIAGRGFSREFESARSRVIRLYEQIEQCRSQVTLSEEDLKLTRMRYEGGEGAALDVVVSQNQLAQARSNYYSTIAGYLGARLDLEVASGR
jgi:outer membrane protein